MRITSISVAMTLVGLLPWFALSAQVEGNYFAGFQSGSGNTGSYNTLVGYQSGVSPTMSGFGNTFLGYRTGFLTVTGGYNTFIGSSAGYNNSSGLANTFVGFASGINNTTGVFNCLFGYAAGFKTTTGGSNSFYGNTTGFTNSTGSNNSFFGARAGYLNTSGSDNTLMGFSAGERMATGTENTFAGTFAGRANTTGLQNVFIGSNAGKVNTTGRENTFVGRSTGLNNKTGRGNSLLGFLANTASDGNLINATAIGTRALVSASNALVLGAISGINGAAVTTSVGIGTTAPAYLLHVNGTAAKPGGGSWSVASDKKLKQEIKTFEDGLAKVMEIKPVWFRYNGKAGLPTDKTFVGVIAQDMQIITPYSVGEFVYQDSSGNQERYLDYDASALTYMLVNAVKELQIKNELHVQEIKQLQETLEEVKKLLNIQLPGDIAVSARVWQNFPNPFAQSTTIRYHIPETSTDAQLVIFNVTGQEVFRMELVGRGQGEVEISDRELSSGSYIYHLVLDGTSVNSKTMVLAK